MTKERVYCSKCKNARWYGCSDLHKVEYYDWFDIYTTVEECSIKNKNNNCKWYKEKK